MKNSGLDSEPPSKFEGKKEVKKKNGTLPQLIVSLRNEKNNNRSANIAKNLEKEVISNWERNIFDIGYLKNEEGYVENNFTLTNNVILFAKPNITSNRAILESHYSQRLNNINFTENNSQKFYERNPYYSIQKSKEEKKDNFSIQSKEQIEKETFYLMYGPDEDAEKGN